MGHRTKVLLFLLLAFLVFMGWRFIRPMNIFTVTDAFDRPVSTANAPALMSTLGAEECATCHQDFYKEWKTTMHSQAWTDPYFQADWQFDGRQQICKNCHTPLDRQQEQLVLGFKDKTRWKPILVSNPDFDPKLQHEGVTCAACHLRDGKIVGVLGIADVPHPVKKIDDPNTVCVQCHVVEGERWDTFFRFPPCGTVAEIRATPSNNKRGKSGEIVLPDKSALGCVQCHMPLVQRPLVEGGLVRPVRRHLWRGGHDPDMVKSALEAHLEEITEASTTRSSTNTRTFVLTLSNVGAAHYLPTGTPDRFLSIEFNLIDGQGRVQKTQRYTAKRNVLWRPFIIELGDTRLPRWKQRQYEFTVPVTGKMESATVQVVVRYHLLDERRRKRIGYNNKEPIAYEVFRQIIPVTGLVRE